MEKSTTYNFADLRKEINDSVEEHNKYGGWDGLIYNGTTILAIVLTSVAALIPNLETSTIKILAGMGALLIAVDRALNWGGRWIYHRQMRHEYLIILAKISFYENLPENFTLDEKKIHYLEIYTELYNTRRKEVSMPGVKTK